MSHCLRMGSVGAVAESSGQRTRCVGVPRRCRRHHRRAERPAASRAVPGCDDGQRLHGRADRLLKPVELYGRKLQPVAGGERCPPNHERRCAAQRERAGRRCGGEGAQPPRHRRDGRRRGRCRRACCRCGGGHEARQRDDAGDDDDTHRESGAHCRTPSAIGARRHTSPHLRPHETPLSSTTVGPSARSTMVPGPLWAEPLRTINPRGGRRAATGPPCRRCPRRRTPPS